MNPPASKPTELRRFKKASYQFHFSLCLLAVLCGVGANLAFAGSVFVSGHDPDFHATGGANTVGAQNLIDLALDFVRNGNNAPILFIQSNTANIGLGDHLDSELGLIASGYTAGSTPGSHYVKENATQFATENLSLYSAIFVPSDHGGTLTGDDLQALNARSTDIIAYVNAGGGLFALAEDGFHTAATDGSTPALFGFLPFLATSAPLTEFENGNTLSPFGVSLGLTPSDINGNFSHNIFTSTGGMTPVDFDAGGEILSLATRRSIDSGGVVPEAGSTILLLPWAGREPRDFTSDRPQPCCSAVKPAVYFSTATVLGLVCILRQLGHIREKRRRLANEKPHVR